MQPDLSSRVATSLLMSLSIAVIQNYSHVFADASQKAYGATAYLVCGNQSSLAMAKSRVAPTKKKLTLPELKLMAALTTACLASHLQEHLQVTKVTWSDSQIVFHWLKSTKFLKAFINTCIQLLWEDHKEMQDDGLLGEMQTGLWTFACPWRMSNSFNNDFERLFRFHSFSSLCVKFWWFPVSVRYCILVLSLLMSLIGKVINMFFVPAKKFAQYDRHVCNAVKPKWHIVEFLSLLYFLLPHKRRSFKEFGFMAHVEKYLWISFVN